MTEPFWFVESSFPPRLVMAKADEVAFARVVVPKVFAPVKVLLSLSRVEDAAETVMVPPAEKVVPLMVPKEPTRRLVPMVVLATSWPVELPASMELAGTRRRLVPIVDVLT